MENLRIEHRRCNRAAGDRPDPPRATIARPLGTLAVGVLVIGGALFGGQGWQHSGRCRGEPRPLAGPPALYACTRDGWVFHLPGRPPR